MAFNKTVVTRYRISLEQRHYAPSTINLRLAAVRRLAYEASDCGLLSPDLAAGIRRLKGARPLGVRIGNWLTAEEGKRLIGAFGASTPKELRNRAMIAVLIGCGLRRAEAAALKLEDVQLRGRSQRLFAHEGQPGGERRGRPHRGCGLIFFPRGNRSGVAWLGKAYQRRSPLMEFLKEDPDFDHLRSDTRFSELVRRAGLED